MNDDLDVEMLTVRLGASLVKSIAQNYADSGVAIQELIRAGRQGLAYALENFEIEGGSRFSTYATRCIGRHIEHAISMRQPG